MSRIVTLSTGAQVYFKDQFTHAASVAFSEAINKGVMDEEDSAGNVVRKTPVVNKVQALVETLFVMVEKVKEGDKEFSLSREWLGELPEPDFDSLAAELVAARKETREGIERGKKSSR